MSIIRVKHRKNFTVIPNDLLNDKRLDWRTVGLLCYLLSKPSDWIVSATTLAKQQRGNGRNAIYDCLKQMQTAGYAEFTQEVGQDGRFKNPEWVITPLPENREPVTANRKPLPENRNAVIGTLQSTLDKVVSIKDGRQKLLSPEQELEERRKRSPKTI